MAARNDYERYLEEKWAGIETPYELLAAAVEDVCQESIAVSERWIRSYANEVHAVTTTVGTELIVRIARKAPGHFDRERWARGQPAAVGVPVPEIYGVVTQQHGEETLSFSIEERLPGETVDIASAAGALDEPTSRRVMAQAGEFLAAIHSVPLQGWGKLDGTGAAAHPTRHWFLAYLRTQESALRAIARRYRLAFSHVELALELLEADDSGPEPTRPCLVHGDFGAKHVLVDKGEIVAILDFEEALSGVPFDDLAFWYYDRTHDPASDALRTGYEGVSPLLDFDRRLTLGFVGIGLAYLYAYGTQPEGATPPGFLTGVARRLRSDVRAASTT